MDVDQLCRRYLSAIEAGDYAAVLSLFRPNARVHSPLYGLQPVDLFFANVFSDTARSTTRLIRILTARKPDNALAVQFEYSWTLSNGTIVEFEVVNILELDEDGLVTKLTVLYDTAPLRAAHEDAARQRESGTAAR